MSDSLPPRSSASGRFSAVYHLTGSRQDAARTAAQVSAEFAGQLDYVVEGEVGGLAKPSQIRDVMSGKILR